MFRSFVLFIAAHYYFSGCEVFPCFFNFEYYLAVSISPLLLFIFSLVISHFPYFKFVTFKTRVILFNTLKKEGRAFQNIGKYIPQCCVISLANFRLLFNLQLIRSSTARGSGTSILSLWSLQMLTSTQTTPVFQGRCYVKHIYLKKWLLRYCGKRGSFIDLKRDKWVETPRVPVTWEFWTWESDICLASKFASTIVVTDALGYTQTFQRHFKIKFMENLAKVLMEGD